jgi:hypothetical protein
VIRLEVVGESAPMESLAQLLDANDDLSRVRLATTTRPRHGLVAATVRPNAIAALGDEAGVAEAADHVGPDLCGPPLALELISALAHRVPAKLSLIDRTARRHRRQPRAPTITAVAEQIPIRGTFQPAPPSSPSTQTGERDAAVTDALPAGLAGARATELTDLGVRQVEKVRARFDVGDDRGE